MSTDVGGDAASIIIETGWVSNCSDLNRLGDVMRKVVVELRENLRTSEQRRSIVTSRVEEKHSLKRWLISTKPFGPCLILLHPRRYARWPSKFVDLRDCNAGLL